MSNVMVTDERIAQAIANQRSARARVNREEAIAKIKAMAAETKPAGGQR